ncbi:MAG: hypothetical protein AAF804_04245 [Bacteroidota bacterium]
MDEQNPNLEDFIRKKLSQAGEQDDGWDQPDSSVWQGAQQALGATPPPPAGGGIGNFTAWLPWGGMGTLVLVAAVSFWNLQQKVDTLQNTVQVQTQTIDSLRQAASNEQLLQESASGPEAELSLLQAQLSQLSQQVQQQETAIQDLQAVNQGLRQEVKAQSSPDLSASLADYPGVLAEAAALDRSVQPDTAVQAQGGPQSERPTVDQAYLGTENRPDTPAADKRQRNWPIKPVRDPVTSWQAQLRKGVSTRRPWRPRPKIQLPKESFVQAESPLRLGIHYGQTRLNLPADFKARELRTLSGEARFQPWQANEVGLNLEWAFQRNWLLQSGVSIRRSLLSAHGSLTAAYNSARERLDPEGNLIADLSFFLSSPFDRYVGVASLTFDPNPNLTTGQLLEVTHTSQQSLTWIQLPLGAAYQFGQGRAYGLLEMGLTLNQLLLGPATGDLSIVSGDQEVITLENTKFFTEGKQRFFLGGYGGLSFGYAINQKWHLRARGQYSYQFLSWWKETSERVSPLGASTISLGIQHRF